MSEWSDGLREIADLFDEVGGEPAYSGKTINLFCYEGPEELLALARKFGGKWEKDETEGWYILRRRFGPHSIELNADRGTVCTKVEVGEETVEVPDPDAPKVTVTRPVYEWQCPESLNALVW